MSLGCGFAANSTIPEMRPDADRVPVRMNFRRRRTPLDHCCWSGQSLSVLVRLKRKGCDCGPLVSTIAAFAALHLPYGSEAFWVLLALSDETR